VTPPANEPTWKKVVGGMCGIGIMIAVVLLARRHGATGEDVQRWEEAIVVAAAVAGVVLWLVKRKKRRQD
jgi:hypothetical protein